jgi:outer membrane protein assembly complex protein YaeT
MTMGRRLPLLVLLALGLLAAGCREEGTVRVRSVTFVGVESVDEGRLKAALATRQSSMFPWGRQYRFERSRFEDDLKRVAAFYADRGYPNARVTAFDVSLNDTQDEVDVRLTIDEGLPLRVTGVVFRGFDPIPLARLDRLRDEARVRIGAPRDRQQVLTAQEFALNELRENGFPYARVSSNEAPGSEHEVAVEFVAEPGPQARFGPIEVVGNQSVGEDTIRQKVGYRPGEVYRRSVVQDTQRTLYGMELFTFVNIEVVDPESQSAEARTRVTVVEGRHQRVNLGLGYGTEDKARVQGDYRHVNFLGGARTAGVQARWSSLDRGVRASFNQPFVFSPHFSYGLDGQGWRTITPAYESIVQGGRATLTHRANPRSSWAVSMGSEWSSSEISDEALNDPTLRDDLIAIGLDPTTGKQEGLLTDIAFDFQHTTTDSVLNASRGYQIGVHGESAGNFLPGSFDYTSVSFDARHFLPLHDRVVVASRLQLGNINPAGDDPANVPFSKKYLLGGSTSIRGWGRYEVSPLSGSGLPIGGNTMMAFTSELRASLAGSFGGVLFVDGGNVWDEDFSLDLGDLRYAVGAGFRYQTPVGPIRLDWGYQINPIEGLLVDGELQSRRWRVHFSIGQAF